MLIAMRAHIPQMRDIHTNKRFCLLSKTSGRPEEDYLSFWALALHQTAQGERQRKALDDKTHCER